MPSNIRTHISTTTTIHQPTTYDARIRRKDTNNHFGLFHGALTAQYPDTAHPPILYTDVYVYCVYVYDARIWSKWHRLCAPSFTTLFNCTLGGGDGMPSSLPFLDSTWILQPFVRMHVYTSYVSVGLWDACGAPLFRQCSGLRRAHALRCRR